MTKTCTKCGLNKDISEFHAAKRGLLGRRSDCKACVLIRRSRLSVARVLDRKVCTVCLETKDVSNFRKVRSVKSGYSASCVDCKRAAGREYARTHKKTGHRQYRKGLRGFVEKQRIRSRKRSLAIRNSVQVVKGSNPCHDCGLRFPYYCMDFDHVDPTSKKADVKRVMKSPSRSHLDEELHKCDLVCVNCHRIRGAARDPRTYRSSIPQKVRNLSVVMGLKSKPCTDCGLRFDPIAMDFDHVRGEKVANVSQCIARFGRAKLMTEIEKCDLVCANCHRRRTHSRSVG